MWIMILQRPAVGGTESEFDVSNVSATTEHLRTIFCETFDSRNKRKKSGRVVVAFQGIFVHARSSSDPKAEESTCGLNNQVDQEKRPENHPPPEINGI